jgi:hypothetical protein
MDRDDLALLLAAAERLIATGKASDLVAELAESGMAAEVWADRPAYRALFELQGSRAQSSGLLDLVSLRVHASDAGLRLVLPLPGSGSPPGSIDGGSVRVRGVVVGEVPGTGYAVGLDDGQVLAVDGDLVDVSRVAGFDPDLNMVEVSGVVPYRHSETLPDVTWPEAAAVAADAFAYELLGVGEAALNVAVSHTRDRTQFGRPIAAFQAVRHRLADTRIQLTGAREFLDGTGRTTPGTASTLLGKALAGRAALTAVQAAQQVCGAMGFTWEFGLHAYVRRAYLLDSLFGTSESAAERLGSLHLTGEHPVSRLVAL